MHEHRFSATPCFLAVRAEQRPAFSESAPVIARFNQFNYVGALLGAVLTGLVGADSLRYGFALPMVLVLGILPLAPAFAGRRGCGFHHGMQGNPHIP